MPRTKNLQRIVAIALLALLAACSKDSSDDVFAGADSPLRYVDADTPYLFAALKPMPDDVYEKIEPRMDKLLKSYQDIIRLSLQQGLATADQGAAATPEKQARVAAVIQRLVGMFSAEGMSEAGFDRNSKILFYGQGLLPVLRVTLNDVDAFEKMLQEVEAEAGGEMQKTTLGKLEYRFAGDDKFRVVLAVSEQQLVASLVPSGLSEESLRQVFGLTLPNKPMNKAGRLDALAEKYGFSGHGAGFVDFARLVQTFTEKPSGINAELLQQAGFDAAQLSDVCQAEIRGMAGIAPLLVTGYTAFTEREIASRTVLELRSDIAAGMVKLPTAVPGLGKDHGGLVSFGMSIDLLAARDFYAARLDAMEADPYKCELFAELQAGVAQGRAALNQPIPPIVYGLKGFLAIIENVEGLDLVSRQPPTAIDMRFLLATENAPGLMAMGSMFSPELATLNLSNDGKPVRFQSPQMQGPVDEAWLAMNNNAIALAAGNGAEKKVAGMLKADPSKPPPFFSMHMDASRYYSFVGDAMLVQQDEEMPPELGQAVRDMMQNLAALIDRVSVTVNFTDRGIEMPTVTTLKD